MTISQKNEGRMLARARNQCGITQSVLAERIGAGQSIISDIERGARPLTNDMLARVIDALYQRPVARDALYRLLDAAKG